MRALWITLRRGVRLLGRHRWTFAVPVATLLLPATLLAVRMPDTYEAEAIVHVRPLRPESIGVALPQETVAQAYELMPTVRDRIFTRGNLAAAMPLLRPDVAADDPRALEEIAKSFDWEQVGESAFTVGRTDVEPARAAASVNRVLEAFLESERDERLRRAERNRAFHEEELGESRAEYAALLGRLEAFRLEHADSLPDRKDAIEAELRRLQTEVTAQTGVVGAARQRAQGLDEQLAALVGERPAAVTGRSSAAEEALRLQLAEEQRAMQKLEEDLSDAASRYTEKHPDLIRLRSAVRVQQRAVDETVAALDRVRREAQGRERSSRDDQLAERRRSLQSLRASAQATLDAATASIASSRAREETLHDHLRRIPATAAALLPIQRDLEETAKRLEVRERSASDARAVADFYRGGDASDVSAFRVTAWAVPPAEPTGPGRWRVLLTALGLGLLAGYGLLLLTRHVEGHAVTRAADVAAFFPSAVFVAVPRLGAGRRVRAGAIAREVGITVYVVLLVGASALFLAAHKGWVDAPTWLGGLLGGGA